MSKSRARQKRIPPIHKRHSWFSRLSPEARIIGIVVVVMAIAAAIVLWPRPEEKAAEALTVVIPAGENMHLAFRDAGRQFRQTHKNLDVVLVEAQDEKMPAYEKMWRDGKSGVDVLVGAEGHLAAWARADLIEPWDKFLNEKAPRLSSAALQAGQISEAQQMLPVALALSSLSVTAKGDVGAPETLDGLAALAARLSAPGAPALGADWRGEWAEATLLATAHAGMPAGQNVRMLAARTQDALAWWRRGAHEGWARTPGEAGAPPLLLWAGEQKWFEEGGVSRARLMLPPGASDNGTICVVYGALLPRAAKHKEAARRFVGEVLLSEGFQVALAQRTGLLPAMIAAWPKLKGADWTALSRAAARSVPLTPDLRAVAATEQLARAITRCLNGEMAPEAAAAEIGKLSEGAPASKSNGGR